MGESDHNTPSTFQSSLGSKVPPPMGHIAESLWGKGSKAPPSASKGEGALLSHRAWRGHPLSPTEQHLADQACEWTSA